MRKNAKKIILSLVIMGFVLTQAVAQSAAITNGKASFHKGVNLTKWFEQWTPGIPNLKLYTKQDFEHLKAMGCDVIRVPVHFENLLEDEKTYKINPIVFDYLDMACDWAEELKMFLIIDNHSFNSGTYPQPSEVEKHLAKIWPQVIEHYKNRSDYILFEILNEPVFKNDKWLPIQKRTLELMRKLDSRHTIVVTGADWGGLDSMCAIPPYDDNNLIYSFHFYEPFIFTHQGANWSSKEVENLEGLCFPYDKNRIPELKKGVKGTWVESNIRSTYPKEATEAGMRSRLKKVIDFSNKNHVAVWCGEMGVYNLVSPVQDRADWYNMVGGILLEEGIPFTVWGFNGGFGLFKKGTAEHYPEDLEPAVVKGVGLIIPPDAVSEKKEFSLPYVIYDDFPTSNITFNTWGIKKSSIGKKAKPEEGMLCIECKDFDRYSAINFGIGRTELNKLEKMRDSAVLSFKIKFTRKDQNLQIRFCDTDLGDDLPPWRLTWNIKSENYELNKWHAVEIPLKEMKDNGGWSNARQKWYSSQNQFTFERVEELLFCAEDGAIPGEIFLDDIQIR